jgi:apolipoprotein N-acyltransferase
MTNRHIYTSKPLGNFTASLLASVAGYAHAMSIATPWDGQPLWWLQIIAMAVLVWLVDGAPTVKHAALRGFAFSLTWLVGCVWWLYISMHNFGGLAAPLAALAVLGLCAFLSLYYAAACGAFRALTQQNRAWAAMQLIAFKALLFAALWLLAELARNSWFTGFPWGAGGYAHVDGPLIHLAPWVGQYGVGFICAVLSAGLAFFIRLLPQFFRRTDSGASMAVRLADVGGYVFIIVLTGLAMAYSANTQQESNTNQPAGKVTVALLQGNIPQGEKFDTSKGVPLALDWYAQQLQSATATMVIAPETAIPLLPQQLPDDYFKPIQDKFSPSIRPELVEGQAALIGIPLGSYEDGYTNSTIGLKPGQKAAYRYDKHHLVPFGEFIPPLFKWFTQMMNIPLGDFNRGAVGQPSFAFAGQRWAPNICYEDLFGDELAARFIDPEKAPTVMVNISNIGWFGNSIAIDQHLHISRMRAIELARPMVRATNTGPTVIIDHRGRVTHSLERYTRGVLVGEVEGRGASSSTGAASITPYAWWAARFGLWPLWLLGVAIVLLAAHARFYWARGVKSA